MYEVPIGSGTQQGTVSSSTSGLHRDQWRNERGWIAIFLPGQIVNNIHPCRVQGSDVTAIYQNVPWGPLQSLEQQRTSGDLSAAQPMWLPPQVRPNGPTHLGRVTTWAHFVLLFHEANGWSTISRLVFDSALRPLNSRQYTSGHWRSVFIQ